MSDGKSDNQALPSAGIVARAAVRPARVRLWAGLVLLVCLGVLGLSAYLKPDPRGWGTHAQLGTGPCGMLVMTGYPCPTCGMTTAFAHFVRGRWLRALWAQPAGFVLALGTAALAAAAAWTVVRGRWPTVRCLWLTPYRLFAGLLALFLGSWAFKIVAGLVTGSLPYR